MAKINLVIKSIFSVLVSTNSLQILIQLGLVEAYLNKYIGKSSFRNISLILRIANNIKVSHTTISNWCKQFSRLFLCSILTLMSGMMMKLLLKYLVKSITFGLLLIVKLALSSAFTSHLFFISTLHYVF
jgi:hypothetical protein